MSAFFVEKETIDAAICAILRSGLIMSVERANTLGRSLWLMNAAALEQRYEDEDATEYLDEIYAYEWKPQRRDRVTLIRALDCLLYQCSEGNIPQTKLFKWAQSVADALAGPNLRSTQAYYNAPWGVSA